MVSVDAGETTSEEIGFRSVVPGDTAGALGEIEVDELVEVDDDDDDADEEEEEEEEEAIGFRRKL